MKKTSDIVLEDKENTYKSLDLSNEQVVWVTIGNLTQKAVVKNIFISSKIISYLLDFGNGSDRLWVSSDKIQKVANA